ncbi:MULTISPECIES: efflux RND transporter periplasmic adaptor subunit [Methylobacterium]|uniref:efflux RND transporter periplasmic adaptor subunit n=1 Tax=Methylobacterium TaxID=407 RepID=UPI0013ED23A8|nr:efflux RND transporter periplasmic adaptor subunit [Methylobacterium sp. DB0501]NGM32478.1 efflux RND transporter periplasmic adaptor subunit [Methylobacterium sp. DB0501]
MDTNNPLTQESRARESLAKETLAQESLAQETLAQVTLAKDAPARRRRGLGWIVTVLLLAGAGLAIWFVPALAPVRERLATLLVQREGVEGQAPEPGETAAAPVFRPTKQQLASFGIETVQAREFRPEGFAEGRIGVNEDDNVPVYSPYAGRVTKVMVRAGDRVTANQVLFTLEAADMVSALNDYQAAQNTLAKNSALLKLNQTVAARLQELYQAKAVALKDWQQAQNDVIAAQSDQRSAEAALQAVRNRLLLLGKSNAEIEAFAKSGVISSATEIRAPIAGTIVQRKIGLGQYLAAGSDPAFVIGDLSTVWLVANVRETEVPRIKLGQELEASVIGFPDRVFKARINYMAASLDPATRRLPVRAEIDNAEGLLRPEMFATFTILTGRDESAPAIPASAIVYEGARARIWVEQPDGTIVSRKVALGLTGGGLVQVVDGLKVGERVVTRGSLFIDRAASGDKAS